MSAYTAVLLYGGWMLLLTLAYAFPRVPLALTGKKSIDSWERNKENPDPEIQQRMKAAHLNCIESFPVFAAVVIIAGQMNELAAVGGLAAWVFYARVGQSLVHISGTSFVQVMIRATFFVAQVLMILYMILQLVF